MIIGSKKLVLETKVSGHIAYLSYKLKHGKIFDILLVAALSQLHVQLAMQS